MSERKVLNKYYPPDFDPSKIPKLRLAKERQYTVRIMAPFNMQCKVCGEYIYKGKKFNAKTENIHNENYLGLRKYRFYIRCPKCIGEIVFKTDPENEDYFLEQGAFRLFEAVKLYREAEEKEKRQAEEDAHNPMKLLENRTKDSKLEMEVMENLEELRELNMRKAVINYEEILKRGAEHEAQHLRMQEEEDEAEIKRLFGGPGEDGIIIKRLADDDDNDDGNEGAVGTSNSSPATNRHKRPTDVLTDDSPTPPSFAKKKKLAEATTQSSSKARLSSLVKVKSSNRKTNPTNLPSESATASTETETASTETASTVTNMDGPVSNTDQRTQKSISEKIDAVQRSDSVSQSAKVANTPEEKESAGTASVVTENAESVASSIQEGLSKQKVGSQRVEREKSSGLSLLGGYDFSDSDISDSGSDS